MTDKRQKIQIKKEKAQGEAPAKKKPLSKKPAAPKKKTPAKPKVAVKKKAKKKVSKKEPKTKRDRIPNEKIAEALHASSGYLAVAAEKLGIARTTIYRWVKEDEELKKEVESIQESLLDFAESKLMGQIKDGNMTAICFFLKCKGKDRGYIERSELTGRDGAPLQESAADVFRAMRDQLKSHPEKVIDLEGQLIDE